jgi:heme oxygenase
VLAADGPAPGPAADPVADSVANTPDNGLPAALRLATRELHTRAERSGMMAALLRGRISRAGYTALLVNLQTLYGALEAALQQARSDPLVAPLCRPAWFRSTALAQDLLQLRAHAALPAAVFAPVPATVAYVQRLQAVPGSGRAFTLAAHAWVRYGGDLNGGQVLARIVGQALAGDCPAPPPLAFYDFGPPARVLALRDELRAALGSLVLQPGQQQALVDEACWSFEQHTLMFEQLRQQWVELGALESRPPSPPAQGATEQVEPAAQAENRRSRA